MTTAFVTGGAQGIGQAVARRLVGRGLATTIGDVPAKREQGERVAKDVGARFEALDVTDEASVERAIGAGDVDVLVNCAGVTIAGHPVDAVPLTDWELQIGVNLPSSTVNILMALILFFILRNQGMQKKEA